MANETNVLPDIMADILGSRTSKDSAEGYAYIAGGWFNKDEVHCLDLLEDVCKEVGIRTYEPRHDSPQIGKSPTDEERDANFQSNLIAIKHADFVIASTQGKDMGTIWECGYAFAHGIPVFGFAPLLPAGAPFNLMLAQSMMQVFTSTEQLKDYFVHGKEPERIGAC